MFDPDQYVAAGLRAGCPADQMENFIRAAIILQPRQLEASAAARLCDRPNGPTAVGYGGARGGGKSHWLLAQMGADDCQRLPGLKCLLLRKSGKSNLEHFQDLRLRLFSSLKHSFNASRGILVFDNGSRILAKHYQHEKEIDAFLGLEYDVVGIEEATTLSARKYDDILTCLRTSKPDWRPRLYSTTNPGGIGHAWYKALFIDPYLARQRSLSSSGGEGRGEEAPIIRPEKLSHTQSGEQESGPSQTLNPKPSVHHSSETFSLSPSEGERAGEGPRSTLNSASSANPGGVTDNRWHGYWRVSETTLHQGYENKHKHQYPPVHYSTNQH